MEFEHICNYGDILAIPLFFLMVWYFHNIQNKNLVEYILYFFSISGLILDILFTYYFLVHYSKKKINYHNPKAKS